MVAILGANSVSGGYEIDNSLRFNSGDSAKLGITPGSAGDRKTWTFSCWFKLGKMGVGRQLFDANGVGTTENDFFNIGSSGTMQFRIKNSNSIVTNLIPTQVFRDPSAWYHVVLAWDTTQATDSDRVKIYINGIQITDFSTAAYPTLNLETSSFNNTVVHSIGAEYYGGSYYAYYDGYMSEINFINSEGLAPTDFGEFNDNGVWIPKAYEGTYGTNGFYLEFKETGTGQNSSGIGADTSGNDHHWAVTNLAATDVTTDTPTNNFATLLPLRSGEGAAQQVFSEGNLQWTSTTRQSNATGASINFPPSGKWYVECYVKTAGAAGDDDFGIGIQGVAHDSMAKTNPATATYGDSAVYVTRRDSASRIEKNLANVIIGDTYSYTAGAIVQLAFDADSGKVYFGLNNAYWAEDGGTDGNPSSGTNHSTTLTSGVDYFYTLSQYSSTYVSVTNFGHDSSFAGNKSSGSANANDGEYGDFFYAPPTGFKCLCTKNLGEFG